MDSQELTAFVAVAELGSFTRAGEALHLSQSATSKRIAALEQSAGRPLLDRIGRQVALTEAGRALLPYARQVSQSIVDARRALSQLDAEIGGRLSFGTSHHVGLHRLPPVLRAFTLRYADVDLDIHFMDSERACEAVLAGRLELAIVTLPLQPDERLATELLWPDPMSVVVAPDHPLAKFPELDLEELGQWQAVLPDAATFTHRIVRRALDERGIAPRIRLSTNYLETLKMLVGIGLGWSVLPDAMCGEDLVRIPLAELELRRDLGLVRHVARTESAAAAALSAAARAQATAPRDADPCGR